MKVKKMELEAYKIGEKIFSVDPESGKLRDIVTGKGPNPDEEIVFLKYKEVFSKRKMWQDWYDKQVADLERELQAKKILMRKEANENLQVEMQELEEKYEMRPTGPLNLNLDA